MSIYEGTNGIQALDLVTRKLAKTESHYYQYFSERIRIDLKKSDQSPIRAAVESALEQLDECSAVLLARMSRNPRDAEAGASAYLALVGLVGGGWMWLRMAGATSSQDVVKSHLAFFYAEYLMAEVATLKTRALSTAALYDGLTAEDLIR
jgi:hypothetical protein